MPNSGYSRAGASTPCFANASGIPRSNVQIVNAATGRVISSGYVANAAPGTQIKVTDTDLPHDLGAFQDFSGYNTDGSNARYDGTFNMPFWNSQECTHFNAGSDVSARADKWADPTTATVKMVGLTDKEYQV
jgi:hypothetical protein